MELTSLASPSPELMKALEAALEAVDEGIHVVDANGVTIFYNRAAAMLDNLESREVIGRPLLEVFPSLTPETSTLLEVLRTGKPIPDSQQTFTNYKGDQITTLNTTLPLHSGGKLVGAVEISRNLTVVRELAHKVVDLQVRLYGRPSDAEVEPERESEGSGLSGSARSDGADVHGRTREGAAPAPGQGGADAGRAPGCAGGRVAEAGSEPALFTMDDIVGDSPAIEELRQKVSRIARLPSPILVYGETGTGKEMLVQAVHSAGPRRHGPFVAQNCAALPEGLLEGILFGTTRGSFTGAQDRPGLFEIADGGTLFLDEIDSMPANLQAKLLRAVSESGARRVGDSRLRRFNIRLAAAINSHPTHAVESGSLRADLYYRLSVIVLPVPPLRERKEDIPRLVAHFVSHFNRQFGTGIRGVTPEVMEVFVSHDWPGNIRELRNTIEGAMALVEGDAITLDHIRPDLIGAVTRGYRAPTAFGSPPAAPGVTPSPAEDGPRVVPVGGRPSAASAPSTPRAASAASAPAVPSGAPPAAPPAVPPSVPPASPMLAAGEPPSGGPREEREGRVPVQTAKESAAPLRETVKDTERQLIVQALTECGGNLTRTAQTLGIPRQTLQYRIKLLKRAGLL